MSVLNKLFGDPNARVIRSFEQVVTATNGLGPEIQRLDDDALQRRFLALRATAGGSVEKLNNVLPESFALTREAATRAIGQRHYDVQLIGGITLHQGKIAEMKTGEGKTLVATLPLALNALVGNGAHLVTVNDYLAKRDTGWMGRIYELLGLSCAAIVHEQAFRFDSSYTDEQTSDPLLRHLRPISRSEAYRADITYGTNNEFGFDYLRDNMVSDRSQLVQRGLFYAIVDEVDSILIDEARTPLIISAPVERAADEYRRVDSAVKNLKENEDYKVDEKLKSVYLTDSGTNNLESMLGIANLYSNARSDLLNIINQSLKANSSLFQRDKQYVVRDGEIVIVDEFTGRLMMGRRYSEGLHQAIEAKESVDIKQESQTLATITFQNLFRMYGKLAGMTGTAATEAEELHKIYKLDVVVIPTNRPMVRRDAVDRVYKNERGKFMAVVADIRERHERGQPILAGTISIAKNEVLASLLEQEGIPYQMLNAKNHEREAATIAQAGKKGTVTIATNMAGRGVDIILGGNPPDEKEQREVRELGGLHVIGTERHESRRIDLQLRGRSGRQGDPGSSQFFVSMEDDLMRVFGSDRMKGLMDRLGVPDDMPIENRMVSRSIESAQKKVEGHNFDIRKHLVEYDDVMNKHREVIYRKRLEVLSAPVNDVAQLVEGIVEQEIETMVSFHVSGDSVDGRNLDGLYDAMNAIFPFPADARWELRRYDDPSTPSQRPVAYRERIIQHLTGVATSELRRIEQSLKDRELYLNVVRSVILRTIDALWIEHLDLMEHLREGIGLRGYGQREPLVEYKREAFGLFTQLINSINQQIASTVFKIIPALPQQRSPMESDQRIMSAPAKTMHDESTDPSSRINARSQPLTAAHELEKVGRNDPCPCGSGKKFKRCFLANDPSCKLRTGQRR